MTPKSVQFDHSCQFTWFLHMHFARPLLCVKLQFDSVMWVLGEGMGMRLVLIRFRIAPLLLLLGTEIPRKLQFSKIKFNGGEV